jgi:ABC-2 type transport system ATP-binding protein
MIRVEGLRKEYKLQDHTEGLFSGIKNLFHRTYETKRAVNDISFEINEGELVGFIGPNGAGKSTSIKMLTGILVPTSGYVEINGIIPYKDRKANSRQIGAVFGQKTQLWWDVPVIESLKLLRDIYDVSDREFKKNLEMFNDLLELRDFQQQPVRQLSLGQRMKADLAAALLHNPRILFLDEPTIGVDIVTKEKLRSFIKDVNREQKVTVLLTTHDMSDIEKLCSRMIIIDHGQLIYDGGIEQIRTQHGKFRTLIVQFEYEIPDFDVPHSELVKSEANKKWFRFNRNETSPSDLISFITKQFPIIDLLIEEPEIEEMVRNIYQGK